MALAVEQLAADRSRLVAGLGETEDWTILAASHKAGVPCTVPKMHDSPGVSGNTEGKGKVLCTWQRHRPTLMTSALQAGPYNHTGQGAARKEVLQGIAR